MLETLKTMLTAISLIGIAFILSGIFIASLNESKKRNK